MSLASALIVSEPYAGLQAQALGLAERAGLSTDLRVLNPRAPWKFLPARLWPNPLAATDFGAMPDRDLAIGCGGVAAAVLSRLRKHGTRTVQVQNPRLPIQLFDAIVANVHDELTGPNVIVARTAMHRVTQSKLRAARAVWAPRLIHLRRPLVAALVGGANGRFKFGEGEALQLALKLSVMMKRDKTGLVLTPSRRTGAAQINVLRKVLEPLGAYIWDMQGENPYFGFLALADAIVVTMDSISMVSEAVATDAPVLLHDLPGRSRRIGLFQALLQQERRVRPFAAKLETWTAAPLDDTDMAAHEMRRLLEG